MNRAQRIVQQILEVAPSGFDKSSEKRYNIEEVSPPGWGGSVEKMKQHHSDKIDNPFALAWFMAKRGAKPHYMESGKKKRQYRGE